MDPERKVSPKRQQLVIVVADESSSMAGAKAQAATEGIREMIYRCQTMGPEGVSLFRMAVIYFAHIACVHPAAKANEVWEIDPEAITLYGDSGGTNILAALSTTEELLLSYRQEYLSHHPEPLKHPLPLVLLFSDGQNGYGCPLRVANRIKEMQLAGGNPTVVTAGVSVGSDRPDVELLQAIASRDPETGLPCYFEADDAGSLARFLAAVGSSAASSPRQALGSLALIPHTNGRGR